MQKWYQKTVWIIVLLFVFFPVGIYLMWKYTDWEKAAKGLITAFLALCVILFAVVMLLLVNRVDNEEQAVSDNVEETETAAEEPVELNAVEQLEAIANSSVDTLTKAQSIAAVMFPAASVEYDTDRNMIIATIQKNTVDSTTLNSYRETSYSEMADYMEYLYHEGTDFNFVFNSTLNDGNETNEEVISATFTNASISEINWEGFDYNSLPEKAEMFNIREDLQ